MTVSEEIHEFAEQLWPTASRVLHELADRVAILETHGRRVTVDEFIRTFYYRDEVDKRWVVQGFARSIPDEALERFIQEL